MNEINKINKIDARGLSCPEPVIMTQRALKSNEKEYLILVDNVASKENVSRFANHGGYKVEVEEKDDEFVLHLFRNTLLATFYSHYGAMKFKKDVEEIGGRATLMPVPRSVSSSCGTCVKFDEIEGYDTFDSNELEQIYRQDGEGAWKKLEKEI